MSPEKEGFVEYIGTLSAVSGISIVDFTSLKQALRKRLDFFAERGCLVSDHGLDYAEFCPLAQEEEELLVKKSLSAQSLSQRNCGSSAR